MNNIAPIRMPYVGLMPYSDSEEDAQFFFGRERKKEIIVANLIASRLTLLYGPSGVGKSSVLRAGVAHHLRKQAKNDLQEGRLPRFAVVIFDSWRDADPLAGLLKEIEVAVVRLLPNRVIEPPLSRTTLVESLVNLTVPDRTSKDIQTINLLIILDQFEEYFLYHANEAGAGSFAEEFPRAVNAPGIGVSFLISMRDDSITKLDRFKGRIPNLLANRLSVNYLNQAAAREAIVRPLLQYNLLRVSKPELAIDPEAVGQVLADKTGQVGIESQLVNTVLEKVRRGEIRLGESGRGTIQRTSATTEIETAYLQLVMTRLWSEEKKKGSRVLRLETLNELGGATEIVASHLEAVMNKLSLGKRDTAALMFNYLVTPTGGKIALNSSDLGKYTELDSELIKEVFDDLADSSDRILRSLPVDTSEPSEHQSGQTRYEIFHDALAGPIRAWREKHVEEMATRRAQQQAEAEAQAQIEEQRAHAEAQIERQRARSRRLRRVLIWAAVALILMSAFTVLALKQTRVADKERLKAQELLTQVEKQKDEARVQRDIAEQAKDRADRALIAAQSSEKTAQEQKEKAAQQTVIAQDALAQVQKEETETRKQKDIADQAKIAAQASERIARQQKEEADRQRNEAVVAQNAADVARRKAEESAEDLQVQTTKAQQATIKATEALAQVQFARREELKQYLRAEEKEALIRKTDESQLYILHTLRQFPHAPGAVFSSDSTSFITGTYDGKVVVWAWNPHDRDLEPTVQIELTVPRSPNAGQEILTAVSKDDRYLAASADNDRVLVWDKEICRRVYDENKDKDTDREQCQTAAELQIVYDVADDRARSKSINGLAFSPDGNFLVAGSADGIARVWNLRDCLAQQPCRPFLSLTDQSAPKHPPLRSVVFSPNGGSILTASGDKVTDRYHQRVLVPGIARVWDFDKCRAGRECKPLELRGHTGAVNDAEYNRAGDRIVTASDDGTAIIWDARSGRRKQTIREHAGILVRPSDHFLTFDIVHKRFVPMNSAVFTPDGKFVLTTGEDLTARLWDLPSGNTVRIFRGHASDVLSGRFSADGATIITTSKDSTVRLWDVFGPKNYKDREVIPKRARKRFCSYRGLKDDCDKHSGWNQ